MLSLILGIIGAISGCLSLFIQWTSYRRESARLLIDARIFQCSNEILAEHHLRFELRLRNTGFRPASIFKAEIIVPPGKIFIEGKPIQATRITRPVFSALSSRPLIVEPHGQKIIVIDPFDGGLLRDCEETCIIEIRDALDTVYKIECDVPPPSDLMRLSRVAEDFHKRQRDSENSTDDGSKRKG